MEIPNMMFETSFCWGFPGFPIILGKNPSAKNVRLSQVPIPTKEIYDVINLVDHVIRLAVALAGLGMVHPSEHIS